MNKDALKITTATLLTKGKGILAADETPANIGKKFAALHVENSSDNRRKYREMLFSTPGIEQYISGVILQDETINQFASVGVEFSSFLKTLGILSGIKVDFGLGAFNDDPIETITKGLEGLGDRLEAYKLHLASFAKWRAVIHIDAKNGKPTSAAMQANAEDLAEYAYICQQHDIVPIVEPEVLMDGDHTIDTSYRITYAMLETLFNELERRGVFMEGILLKPNMIIPGLMCLEQAHPEVVAQQTLECFKLTVPADVPGIVFLSGWQSDDLAIQHLALMNQSENLPWILSFSYGRALQRKALTLWKGAGENVPIAQQAFIEQTRLNALATLGQLSTH
jgi:fructose-bisphosphate aldolase class I